MLYDSFKHFAPPILLKLKDDNIDDILKTEGLNI